MLGKIRLEFPITFGVSFGFGFSFPKGGLNELSWGNGSGAKAACQFNQNAAIQIARNIVEANNWRAILNDIESAQTACDKLLVIIDAHDQRARTERLQSVLHEQNRKVDDLLKVSRKQYEEYGRSRHGHSRQPNTALSLHLR